MLHRCPNWHHIGVGYFCNGTFHTDSRKLTPATIAFFDAVDLKGLSTARKTCRVMDAKPAPADFQTEVLTPICRCEVDRGETHHGKKLNHWTRKSKAGFLTRAQRLALRSVHHPSDARAF